MAMPPTPALDVVFFDVDDTLYSTTEFALKARRNAIRAMIDAGLRVTEEKGFAELMEVVAEFSSNYNEHFGRLLDRLGPQSYARRNPAVLVAAGVVAYHETKEGGMRLLPDVRLVLNTLRDAPIRLGVISAGLRVKQAEKLIRLGALDYFEPLAIFFSDQMGVSKPNPKIYQKACTAIGVDPQRALYVGDRPGHDAVPAASIGMKTVHYTGAGGKYAQEPCEVAADHTFKDLSGLLTVLREVYGIPV